MTMFLLLKPRDQHSQMSKQFKKYIFLKFSLFSTKLSIYSIRFEDVRQKVLLFGFVFTFFCLFYMIYSFVHPFL